MASGEPHETAPPHVYPSERRNRPCRGSHQRWSFEEATVKTHTIIESPLGPLTLVNTDGVLSGVFMERRWSRPDRSSFGPKSDEGFEEATRQLNECFAGGRTDFTLPIAAEGDDFDKQVWQELTTIPHGETRSYRQVTAALGDRTAV